MTLPRHEDSSYTSAESFDPSGRRAATARGRQVAASPAAAVPASVVSAAEYEPGQPCDCKHQRDDPQRMDGKAQATEQQRNEQDQEYQRHLKTSSRGYVSAVSPLLADATDEFLASVLGVIDESLGAVLGAIEASRGLISQLVSPRRGSGGGPADLFLALQTRVIARSPAASFARPFRSSNRSSTGDPPCHQRCHSRDSQRAWMTNARSTDRCRRR